MQTAEMLTLRTVDVDAAAAPAGIPDQAVAADHCAVKAADAAVVQKDLRRAARQPGMGLERDAVQHILGRVGEIADRAVGREANRVRDGDTGEETLDFTAMKRVDRAGMGFCLTSHGADPECA